MPIQHLLTALIKRDFTAANEAFLATMRDKVAARLTEEAKLMNEGSEWVRIGEYVQKGTRSWLVINISGDKAILQDKDGGSSSTPISDAVQSSIGDIRRDYGKNTADGAARMRGLKPALRGVNEATLNEGVTIKSFMDEIEKDHRELLSPATGSWKASKVGGSTTFTSDDVHALHAVEHMALRRGLKVNSGVAIDNDHVVKISGFSKGLSEATDDYANDYRDRGNGPGEYMDFDDNDDEMDCPVCNTPNGPMGYLGKLAHFRCRNCGAQYSRKIEEAYDPKLSGTLADWGAKQPYTVNTKGVNRWIPDGTNLVDRAAAFRLTDYLVSAVSGGTIWFYPRNTGSAQSAMLDRGTAD